jgi:predicted DNA-binding WGR domain protein
MSGYKHATIIISQEEFRRLNETDMKLREARKAIAEKETQSQALLKAQRKLEGRQAAYEKLLAEMEQDIALVEADISREIMQQQNEYYQSLFAQIQDLSTENEEKGQLLLDSRQLFEAAIREEKARNKNRFDALHEQLSVISETQVEQEEVARNWIKCGNLLSRYIEDQYDHQKFCPSQFDQAAQRLNLAVDNTRRGFFEAGLQSAQEAYLKFSELRVRVEEETNKWQTAYQLILDQVQSIYSDVSDTSAVPAIGIEGEDLHIDIDLDYWSSGRQKNF